MPCSYCASCRKHAVGKLLALQFLSPIVVWEEYLLGGGGYCGIQGWHDWWSLTCSSPLPLPRWRQSSLCSRNIPLAGRLYKMGTFSPMQVLLLCSCRVVWLGNSSSAGVNVAC